MVRAIQLVEMPEEILDKHISWIDWRSTEEEVVCAVRDQIKKPLEFVWPDEGYEGSYFIKWKGHAFALPLTISGVDRYVTICSLAEILKEEYTFFLRNGFEASDTHGLLVVSNESSKVLRETYDDWLNQNFKKHVQGFDQFSGLRIPYYGNENNNPQLESELVELDKILETQSDDHLQTNNDKNNLWREQRIKNSTDTLTEKLIYYFQRYWWIPILGVWIWLDK